MDCEICLPLYLDTILKSLREGEKWLSGRILINSSLKVKNRDFNNVISNFNCKDPMSFFDATRRLEVVIVREERRK